MHKVIMQSGKISVREDGSYQWTILNFQEMRVIHYSPTFTHKGVGYRIFSRKLFRPSRINLKFRPMCAMFRAKKYIPLNGMSGTFQLRTGCNNESKLHVSRWNNKKSCFEATINYEEFLSENTGWLFLKQLTILFWLRDVKKESKKLSVNTNKTVCEEKKSECKRESEKLSVNTNKTVCEEKKSECEKESEKISVNTNKTVCEEKKSECESKGENVSENANKHLDEEKNFEYDTLKKLQKDFEKLFLSKEDTDVTLEVQQEEFLAHRAILRARSPVFYAMFSHEMSEARSGVVTISDCDPKTFPDFLMYLYTGNTQHISEKNVCHLYAMSDKYEVEELKRKCSEFMKSHISVETFCDFISLALKHSEDDLIRTSTDFFCRSAVEITKTVKWQKFLQENSTVGNELFQKALLKRNNI